MLDRTEVMKSGKNLRSGFVVLSIGSATCCYKHLRMLEDGEAADNADQVYIEKIIADAKRLKAKKTLKLQCATAIHAASDLFRTVLQKCLKSLLRPMEDTEAGVAVEARRTTWRTNIV